MLGERKKMACTVACSGHAAELLHIISIDGEESLSQPSLAIARIACDPAILASTTLSSGLMIKYQITGSTLVQPWLVTDIALHPQHHFNPPNKAKQSAVLTCRLCSPIARLVSIYAVRYWYQVSLKSLLLDLLHPLAQQNIKLDIMGCDNIICFFAQNQHDSQSVFIHLVERYNLSVSFLYEGNKIMCRVADQEALNNNPSCITNLWSPFLGWEDFPSAHALDRPLLWQEPLWPGSYLHPPLKKSTISFSYQAGQLQLAPSFSYQANPLKLASFFSYQADPVKLAPRFLSDSTALFKDKCHDPLLAALFSSKVSRQAITAAQQIDSSTINGAGVAKLGLIDQVICANSYKIRLPSKKPMNRPYRPQLQAQARQFKGPWMYATAADLQHSQLGQYRQQHLAGTYVYAILPHSTDRLGFAGADLAAQTWQLYGALPRLAVAMCDQLLQQSQHIAGAEVLRTAGRSLWNDMYSGVSSLQRLSGYVPAAKNSSGNVFSYRSVGPQQQYLQLTDAAPSHGCAANSAQKSAINKLEQGQGIGFETKTGHGWGLWSTVAPAHAPLQSSVQLISQGLLSCRAAGRLVSQAGEDYAIESRQQFRLSVEKNMTFLATSSVCSIKSYLDQTYRAGRIALSANEYQLCASSIYMTAQESLQFIAKADGGICLRARSGKVVADACQLGGVATSEIKLTVPGAQLVLNQQGIQLQAAVIQVMGGVVQLPNLPPPV